MFHCITEINNFNQLKYISLVIWPKYFILYCGWLKTERVFKLIKI